MPTSFQDADEAHEHARLRVTDRRNVSTRIDDMLYVYRYYVVIQAETEAEALRIASTDPRYQEMRDKGDPVPVDEE